MWVCVVGVVQCNTWHLAGKTCLYCCTCTCTIGALGLAFFFLSQSSQGMIAALQCLDPSFRSLSALSPPLLPFWFDMTDRWAWAWAWAWGNWGWLEGKESPMPVMIFPMV